MKFKLLLVVSCSLFLTGCSIQEAQLQASKVWNTITGKSSNTGEITGAQLSGVDQETMDFSESSGSTITGAQNIELSGSQTSSAGENEKIFNSLQSGGLSIGTYNGNNKSLYGNSRVFIQKVERFKNRPSQPFFLSKIGQNSTDLKDYKIDRFIPVKEGRIGDIDYIPQAMEELLAINKYALVDNILYLNQPTSDLPGSDRNVIRLDLEAKKSDIISTGLYSYYIVVGSKNRVILREGSYEGTSYDGKLKNINNGKEFPLDGKKQRDFIINEKENTLSYNEYKEITTYFPEDDEKECKNVKKRTYYAMGYYCKNGKAYEVDVKPTGKTITKSLDEFK